MSVSCVRLYVCFINLKCSSPGLKKLNAVAGDNAANWLQKPGSLD